MFWKFNLDTSGIDTLLAKEDVTLKEILDEEDVLQECKTQNTKLLDFLVQEEIIRELLHYIVDPPDGSVDDAVRYKYSNIACELITLDIDSILEKIANEKECLDILWSFVDTPPPLNPLVASFFSKSFAILISRKCEEIFSYLKLQDAVNKLIVHIEISAIMELFLKFLTDEGTQNFRLEISKWMDDANLIENLIQCLHFSRTQEVHCNSSQLLAELIRIGRDTISRSVGGEDDPLLVTLEKKETTDKLFSLMFENVEEASTSDSTLVNGINIIISLLEIKRPVIEGAEELITEADIERIAQGVEPTLDILSKRLQDFQKLLVTPKNTVAMETTFGTLDPPLGRLRITIASLVATAVATNTKIINEALAKTEVVKTLLDLFCEYEWNNFLHSQVQRCISAILSSECTPRSCYNKSKNNSEEEGGGDDLKNGPNEDDNILLKHLFEECQIVQKCLTMWETNEATEKSGKPRKGYMGHLTIIANDLIKANTNGPNEEAVTALFKDLEEEVRQRWLEFVNKVEETNKKNLCTAVNELPRTLSDSGDEVPAMMAQYAGTLQQAFENYQVQPMTHEFIESFGYDENLDDGEHLRNHFNEVGNIDFSINANEMSENEKLFNSVCDQKIRPYDVADEDEQEDIWEERQLTFISTTEPRASKISTINSDSSDSSEGEEELDKSEGEGEQQSLKEGKETEEKMEVDTEWTANFDNFGMETQEPCSENWATKELAAVSMSTSGENFADFTDISKFEISPSDSAMETEGSKHTGAGSPYEVNMESEEITGPPDINKTENKPTSSDHSDVVVVSEDKLNEENDKHKEAKEEPSKNIQTHVTKITVKSVRVNSKDLVESTDSGSSADQSQSKTSLALVNTTQMSTDNTDAPSVTSEVVLCENNENFSATSPDDSENNAELNKPIIGDNIEQTSSDLLPTITEKNASKSAENDSNEATIILVNGPIAKEKNDLQT